MQYLLLLANVIDNRIVSRVDATLGYFFRPVRLRHVVRLQHLHVACEAAVLLAFNLPHSAVPQIESDVSEAFPDDELSMRFRASKRDRYIELRLGSDAELLDDLLYLDTDDVGQAVVGADTRVTLAHVANLIHNLDFLVVFRLADELGERNLLLLVPVLNENHPGRQSLCQVEAVVIDTEQLAFSRDTVAIGRYLSYRRLLLLFKRFLLLRLSDLLLVFIFRLP